MLALGGVALVLLLALLLLGCRLLAARRAARHAQATVQALDRHAHAIPRFAIAMLQPAVASDCARPSDRPASIRIGRHTGGYSLPCVQHSIHDLIGAVHA